MRNELFVGPPGFLGRLEIECLQEIMNMAFGVASAELEAELGLNVRLEAPAVDIVPFDEVVGYFVLAAGLDESSCVVEQNFWGGFSGTGILLMANGSGKRLVSVFDGAGATDGVDCFEDTLERAAILEVGNILTGACIGCFAELLSTRVSFDPPSFHRGWELGRRGSAFESGSAIAVVLKTHFDFEVEGVDGHLFVATTEKSSLQVRRAVAGFLEQTA